jgi:hypothetical protein
LRESGRLMRRIVTRILLDWIDQQTRPEYG